VENDTFVWSNSTKEIGKGIRLRYDRQVTGKQPVAIAAGVNRSKQSGQLIFDEFLRY
jgi:hypothetical protein